MREQRSKWPGGAPMANPPPGCCQPCCTLNAGATQSSGELTVIIDDHVLCAGIPDPVAPAAVLERHGLCLPTLFGHELLIRFAR